MSREEILSLVRQLASKNLKYDRLLESLEELEDSDPDKFDSLMTFVEGKRMESALATLLDALVD